MPAIASWSSVPPAQAARQTAQVYANGTNSGSELAFNQALSTTLNSAITSGLFTTTQSTSGYGASVIQNQMLMLEEMGYTVSYSGTTLTISW